MDKIISEAAKDDLNCIDMDALSTLVHIMTSNRQVEFQNVDFRKFMKILDTLARHYRSVEAANLLSKMYKKGVISQSKPKPIVI